MLTLLVSVLSSCSENDDQEPFDPITINLVGLGIELNDTSFSTQGFSFTVYQAISDEGNGDNGILLAYPDNQDNPSTLTLDISGLSELSKITASIADQGAGIIDLMRDGSVVESINVSIGGSFQFREFSFDEVVGRNIDAFRYRSLEGIIQSIRLE